MPEPKLDLLQAYNSLHGNLGLAVDFLQSSLEQLGRALTLGVCELPEIQLSNLMAQGQNVRELLFRVQDARQAAWGLGISLGDFLDAKAEGTLKHPVGSHAEAMSALADWQKLTAPPLRAVEPDPEEDDDAAASGKHVRLRHPCDDPLRDYDADPF